MPIPSNGADAKGLLLTALRNENPTVFIEHVRLYATRGPVSEADTPIPFGKLRVARPGSDVTIATYSGMVKPCLDAAEKLADDGLDCEVLDLRTLAPLDTATILESVERTSRLVCVQEGPAAGGWGQAVIGAVVADGFELLDAPPTLVAADPVPLAYAESLEAATMPSVQRIIAACEATVGK